MLIGKEKETGKKLERKHDDILGYSATNTEGGKKLYLRLN